MVILQFIICIVLGAYGLYTIYHSIQLIKEHKTDVEKFKTLYPECTVYKTGMNMAIFLLALAIFGFVMAFSAFKFANDIKEIVIFQITYLGVGVVFAGLAVESYLKQIIYMSDTNFYCVGTTYKFRNIQKIEDAGSIFKKKDFYFQNGEYLRIPEKLGKHVEAAYKNWKINRKKVK